MDDGWEFAYSRPVDEPDAVSAIKSSFFCAFAYSCRAPVRARPFPRGRPTRAAVAPRRPAPGRGPETLDPGLTPSATPYPLDSPASPAAAWASAAPQHMRLLDVFEDVVRGLDRTVIVGMTDAPLTNLALIIMQHKKMPIQFVQTLIRMFQTERNHLRAQLSRAPHSASFHGGVAPALAPIVASLSDDPRWTTPSPDSTMAPLTAFSAQPSAFSAQPSAGVAPEPLRTAPDASSDVSLHLNQTELMDLFGESLDDAATVAPLGAVDAMPPESLVPDPAMELQDLEKQLEAMDDDAITRMLGA